MQPSSRIRRAAPPDYAREQAAAPEPVVEIAPTADGPAPKYPAHWGKGALLNVRNSGADYVVTLHPEEYDNQHPERAMRFANSFELQNFVSAWYMKQSYDPRARG